MLNNKLRTKLFSYAFTNPDSNHYLRELAGIIGEDPGNLSRELKKLEREGLYKTSVRGRMKFYSLNRNYPLFEEYKNIIAKTSGVIGRLRELTAAFEGIVFAFIYGSYAKGKDNAGSDIDLVIVGSFEENSFTKDINAIEAQIGREINFTVYSLEEYLEEKNKSGSFLCEVLKGETIALKRSAEV